MSRYSFLDSLEKYNALHNLNSFSNALSALEGIPIIGVASSIMPSPVTSAIAASAVSQINWSAVERAAEFVSQPAVVKSIGVLNSLSELGAVLDSVASKISPSVLDTWEKLNTAYDSAIGSFSLRHLDELTASFEVMRNWEDSLMQEESFLNKLSTMEDSLGMVVEDIYSDNSERDQLTEEEFKSAVETPAVRQVLADLNTQDTPDDQIAQILSLLKEQQKELHELKTQNDTLSAQFADLKAQNQTMALELQEVKTQTKKKSIVVRILFCILSFLITQYILPFAVNTMVKAGRNAFDFARQHVQQHLQQSDPNVAKFIVKQCMLTNRQCIIRAGRGGQSPPTAYLPLGSVVKIAGSYRKWRLVQYVSSAEECYMGWVQNYKLSSIDLRTK